MSRNSSFDRFSTALAMVVFCYATTASAVDPHQSFYELVSSNGFSVVGVNSSQDVARLDAYLEHPYRFPDQGRVTRDFCYDSYFGIRTNQGASWLSDLAVPHAGYVPGTGIAYLDQQFQNLSLRTLVWSPYGMEGPGAVMLLTVRNDGSTTQTLSVYWLGNFHLGNGAPDPDATSERADWIDGAFEETGPSSVTMRYVALPAPSHHACSPNDPYPLLQSGADLPDTASSGVADDVVVGYQWDLGGLAPGEMKTLAVVLAHGSDAAQVRSFLDPYVDNADPSALLDAEQRQWADWIRDPPQGIEGDRAELWRMSEVILRMGQVREPGRAHGQILASLPPGNWNISWVRDMCYAVVALAKSGHPQEAWDALSFMLTAQSGFYEDYVGRPYKISVTRYYGSGKEESDSNDNGPNIEFDGFGLFLWALGEVVDAWPDAPWQDQWDVIRDQIADVLVALVDPANGLIKADSSIWEVHWNGQQKHYAYTTLAASRGLCAAADLAAKVGATDRQDLYLQTSLSLRRAVSERLTDGTGVIAQSLEELDAASGYRDAAVVEAIGWGLIDPMGLMANATLDALVLDLRPSSGRGFFRNDDGGWYDSQEWIFVDLRSSVAFRAAGRSAVADDLLDWVTAQSMANHGLVSELYDERTADYQGEAPMVGFGAGAFILAAQASLASGQTGPACDHYAPEPVIESGDAGPGGDGGLDAGSGADGGTGGGGGSGGCGCRSRQDSPSSWVLLVLLWFAMWRRRRGVQGGAFDV